MNREPEADPILGEIYLAGERVLPGIYRQIGVGREVVLEHEDRLPASLDGRVACYEVVAPSRERLPSRETTREHRGDARGQ